MASMYTSSLSYIVCNNRDGNGETQQTLYSASGSQNSPTEKFVGVANLLDV